MTDWPVKTLGEVCDLVGGGTPSKDRAEFYGGEIPWATVRDLNVEVLRSTEHSITAEAVKSSSSNIIPSGSVVIATRVGLGKAVIVAQDTAINQDLRGLVVKKPKELLAEYLYWWYLSTVHLVVAAGTGATVQGVKLPFVSGLAIPVPPLEEQKRIVALLDTATARVTELTACYEQARAHANDLFTSALRSALESNPKWISGSLDDLCEVEYGTRVTRKRDGGTKYPVYGGGGATFFLDDFNRQDQMIVSRFAMSEECVRFVPGKFFLNDSGLTVRTRDALKMLQGFLDQQLLARSNEIYATAKGTAQKNMDMTMFREMKIAFPDSLKEQKQIIKTLEKVRDNTTEMVAAYDAKLNAAKNLRQSILEAAFAGDL